MKFNDRDELTKWALESKYLWLFLDYDGTLAEFAPTPDLIEPKPQVFELLEELAASPRIRVTVLSGRRLEHIQKLLPASGIFLAGSYGIELQTPKGKVIHRVEYEEIRPLLDEIKPQWASLIHSREGFYLEDKGWTLAIHARFAKDYEAEQVLTQGREVLERVSPGSQFEIVRGHKFLEIAPRLAHKGEAVAYLLDRYPLQDMHLIYIGDDDRDEEAFPVIQAHGGMAIKVIQHSQTAPQTSADFCFESTKETLGWLRGLV
jgi:trehalose 6-phosphate phosphatase